MLQSNATPRTSAIQAPAGSLLPVAEAGSCADPSACLPEDQRAGLPTRLRDARRAAKLTQAVLAKRLDLKTRDVQKMERGVVSPSLDQVREIATVLGISTASLWLDRELPAYQPDVEPPTSRPAPTIDELAVELRHISRRMAALEQEAPDAAASLAELRSPAFAEASDRADTLIDRIFDTAPQSLREVGSIAMCVSREMSKLSGAVLTEKEVAEVADRLEKAIAGVLLGLRNAGVPLVGHMIDRAAVDYEIGRHFGPNFAQAGLAVATTEPAKLVAEIERLHATEMDIANWSGSDKDLSLTPGGIAQETMWEQVDVALIDPTIVQDMRLMARLAKVVFESLDDTVDGQESRTRHVSRLLMQSVLSQPAASSDDAEIIAECAAFDALEQQFLATFRTTGDVQGEDVRDLERDRIFKLQIPHFDRIMGLRTTTMRGLQAKARSLALEDQELLKPGPGDRRDCLIASIVEDLIGNDASSVPVESDADVQAACHLARSARADVAAAPQMMDDDTFGLLLDHARNTLLTAASTPVTSLAAARLQAKALLEEHEFEQMRDAMPSNGGFNHGIAEQGALLLLKQLAGQQVLPPPDPDANLKASCSELIAGIDGINVAGQGRPIGSKDPRRVRHRELLAIILAQTPSTFEGHQLRAQAVLQWHGGVGGDGKMASCFDDENYWPVIRDLIGASAVDAMAARTREVCATYANAVPA